MHKNGEISYTKTIKYPTIPCHTIPYMIFGPKWSQIGPKCPKYCLKWPKMGPKWPKIHYVVAAPALIKTPRHANKSYNDQVP